MFISLAWVYFSSWKLVIVGKVINNRWCHNIQHNDTWHNNEIAMRSMNCFTQRYNIYYYTGCHYTEFFYAGMMLNEAVL